MNEDPGPASPPKDPVLSVIEVFSDAHSPTLDVISTELQQRYWKLLQRHSFWRLRDGYVIRIFAKLITFCDERGMSQEGITTKYTLWKNIFRFHIGSVETWRGARVGVFTQCMILLAHRVHLITK